MAARANESTRIQLCGRLSVELEGVEIADQLRGRQVRLLLSYLILNRSRPVGREELIGALVRLCKLIDSFTENPALKNVATVDSKEIAKAKENKANADRDLLAIIKLSGILQKNSESLRTSQ